ncbi:MAG TPA: MOSC domain-containing protein [Candidatus Tumulicola sp.]
MGAIRAVSYAGEEITTAIFKEPVEGPVAVRGVNLDGDDQADRSVHGGPYQAVYAYAIEDYGWWSQTLGRPMEPGQFGENVTTKGIDVNDALVGERWRIGSTVLRITIPRVPCFKLGLKMGDPRFLKQFAQALRPGPYLSIVTEGRIAAGDEIEVIWRPAHRLTIRDAARIRMFEHERSSELLVPEMQASWREWARSR